MTHLAARRARRCALLALVIAAGLPAGAHAAPAPGINVAGIPSTAQLDQVEATGAKYVRLFVLWRDLEPNAKGSYDENAINVYGAVFARMKARGISPILVVTSSPQWASGSTNPNSPPQNVKDYADFIARFASDTRVKGNVGAYELWNEEDESQFWSTGPDAFYYAALVKATYPVLKAADPAATVLLGPTTGNNYTWINKLYDNGIKGNFDGVSVHTDTACLNVSPETFYREDGRVGRYAFLGYREVRRVMEARGDPKPIWMTEFGWSSTSDTCSRGEWAGKKPAGVSQADQAEFMTQAWHCMAADDYLKVASWFTLADTATGGELGSYGLLKADLATRKPSWAAFNTYATGGDKRTGPCGDFDGPTVTIKSPVASQQFTGALLISVSATDTGVGLARIALGYDGGKGIRNFTTDLANGKTESIDWQGAKDLPLGKHTIEVIALDKNGNTTKQEVAVTKVSPGALAATAKATFSLGKPRCKGRRCSIRGRLRGPAGLSLDGKAQVLWQWKSRSGRYKTIHKGLKNANKPFTFRQTLNRGGRWRVRIKYLAKPPFKSVTSTIQRFRVR